VTETKLGSNQVFFGDAKVLVNVVSHGSHYFVDELADLDVNSEFFVNSIRGGLFIVKLLFTEFLVDHSEGEALGRTFLLRGEVGLQEFD
jgi:hypothetical protein